jgi:hypothetical protein
MLEIQTTILPTSKKDTKRTAPSEEKVAPEAEVLAAEKEDKKLSNRKQLQS